MDTRRRRALIETFEPRIMYSADPGPAGLAAAVLTAAEVQVDGGEALQGVATELVFIDARLPEIQRLLDDLAAQQQAGRPIEVVVIGADEDGIAVIGDSLAGRSDVAAIHLIGHGADGVAELGAGQLDAASLVLRAGEISAWGDALSADADLLIYGCDVASTPTGESLVDALAALTGADVAASDDPTGAARLGGDWDLEYSSGTIEAAIAPGLQVQQDWAAVLAISANGPVSSTNNLNTNVLTWSHTVASGSDRALFVEISIGTTGTFASSVSYGGTALTLVGRSVAGTVPVEIWRLLNPTVGTANVVVNLSGHTPVAAGATTYNGVNQSSPVRTFYSASGNSTNSSVTVLDSAAGDLVIDVQSWAGQPPGGLVGPGQTLNWSQANTSLTGGSTSEPGAPSVVMSGSFTSAAQWVIGAVAIRPSAGITVTPISGLTVTEAGGMAQFSVVLDTAPTANVTIGLTSSDTTEGTLSASSLTFTSANWNVAQTVTVTGVNDSFVDGNVAFTVNTAAASSADSNYNGRNASDVSVTNTDDDTFNTLVVDTELDSSNDGTTTSIAALMANKGSDGKISLREAITAANNTANGPGGADRIVFGIAGSGTHTITPTSAMTAVRDAVIIDATTDDSFAANGNRPAIVLDGNDLAANGLQFTTGSANSTVRGLVIRDFGVVGIYADPSASNLTLLGNYIGAYTTSGTSAGAAEGMGNVGIWIDAANATIGGTGAGEANLIGGNGNRGILLDANSGGSVVRGNLIGLELDGTTLLGNTSAGIAVQNSSGHLIGGTGAGEGNLIAGNTGDGVRIASTATSVRVLGNRIWSNGENGIDLNNDGVTANDTGDGDSGANNLQNLPVLATARTDGTGQIIVTGTLNSTANSYYRIEFFANTAQDGTGHGEGQTFLGFANVMTNGSGDATINAALTATVPVGSFISATATRSAAGYATFTDTSEFARNIAAVSSTQATLTVTTASDTADGDTTSISTLLANMGADGFISLREAITAANNTANGPGGADRISFNIAAALVGGTHTITPTTSLPTITDAVVIDGTSEPDYVVGRPVIEIDGSQTGSGVHGLVLAPGSGGSTIRGLAINSFNRNDGYGLYLQAGSDNNLIAGNVIGLDADGTTAVAVMNNFGIYVASSGNLIGGTTAAARNVLSNNLNAGVGLWGSNNVVIGNYIGTDATGTLDRGNLSDGVDVFGGSNNRIGGVTAAERNIISGNNRNGIEIAYNVSGTLVQGNYIGTDAGGTLSLGNSSGGIWVGGGATGVTIGGTAAGAGNRIVNNPVGGLYTDTSSVSFTLLGNTFYNNSNLASDLGGDGVTANDTGDGDTGPNNLQNYPEIGSVVSTGGNTTVTGTLRSNASTTYRLEFYSSPGGDASGYGEGQTWLGATSVTTDAAGNAYFSATFSGIAVSAGYVVSATATVDLGGGSYGATSEFSANRRVNTDTRLTAAQDTYVDSKSPTLNYGASGSLVVDYSGGSIGEVRALLQFDLSSLPTTTTIASATLQMVATGITGPATNLNVYQLTESWVEGSGNGTAGAANWTQRQPGTAWTTAGGSFNATVVASLSPSATGLHSWDLTALVRSWVSGATTNNGLIIGSPDGGGPTITYDSSEGTTPPVLVISYSFAANTAPTLDASKSPVLTSTNEDAGAPSGAVGTLVSSLVDFATPAGQVDNVTDADSGALTGIAVTATNTSGGSWWYSTNNGGSWLAMGSVREASARLLSADAGTRLYFQPSADWNGSLADAITFRAWDRSNGANGELADATSTGAATAFSSTSDTASLTVTAVNDAPVVTTAATVRPYVENSSTVVDGSLSVTDADGGNLAGATVSITGGFTRGQDTLLFTNQNGITGSWNGQTGVLTLSGSASVSSYQTALRSVGYLNTSESPSTATRTVSFAVTDGAATSNTATRAVSIASTNDAPTFDAAEFYTTLDIAGAAERGQAVVVQPDGKILVAGHTGSPADFLLVRYNADGSMDTSFGGGDGIVTTAISAGDDKAHGLALQADGKIIVVGETATNDKDFAVLRYNADGSLDTSFGGGDGIVTTDFAGGSLDVAYRVVVQADGRIVVGGASGSGTTDFAVARYLADGTLDTSFSGDGKQTVDFAGSVDEGFGLALDAAGRILQAGSAVVGSQQDFGVVRYNTDGSLDTSFSGDGKLTTAIGTSWDIAHQVAVQAGGKIVVGGYSGASNNDLSLIRLNDDGTPDGGFGTAGVVTTNLGGNESLWDLALQPDGRIVVVGGGGDNHLLVARYLADGSADTSFSGDGNLVLSRSSFEILYAVDIAPDGRIVAAGYGSNATEDLAVLRLSADGALDTRLATGSS
ncbi:MAG: DUF4347 domain-containing protein, partial [Zoogloea sp.]|nr:DUF4347 domain-containing protein [Zoogloea sp.]